MVAHVAEGAPAASATGAAAASAPPLIARRVPGLASPLIPMLIATEVAGAAPAPRAALLTAAAAPAAAFVGFGERGAGLGARGSVVSSAREVASLEAFTVPPLALMAPPLPRPPSHPRPARLPCRLRAHLHTRESSQGHPAAPEGAAPPAS